jgi:voltage-gated potassium channel
VAGVGRSGHGARHQRAAVRLQRLPPLRALHATALGAITGEPLGRSDAFAQITEVLLAIFSVVVFGTLAGTLGAFFLQTRDAPAKATAAEAAQDQ